MIKVASPQELQAELRSIMAFIQGHGPEGRPDRRVVAKKLYDLANRVSGSCRCAARLREQDIEKALNSAGVDWKETPRGYEIDGGKLRIYWDKQDPKNPGWAYDHKGGGSGEINDLDDLESELNQI